MIRLKRLMVLLLEQLEHSLPPGRHVVLPVAQSAGATQHCQLSAHTLTPLVQVYQLPTVPELGIQMTSPTFKLVHPELINGFAVIMADPDTPNLVPILLQVSPLTGK